MINPTAAIFGLETTNPLKIIFNNQKTVKLEEKEPNRIAGLYLQYPNKILNDFVFTIVDKYDNNDVKMTKITKWVIKNIKYKTDMENYGVPELWAAPIMTLIKGSGDCEDAGGFLIHSLGLNAGVPASRLRTYAGEVNGIAGSIEGHAWTAYKRESDNQWVVLDFSYYPTTQSVTTRGKMQDDLRYIDDYFFMDLYTFVTTTGTNRIRDPEGYNSNGSINNIWLTGFFVDAWA